jgi:alpha-glucosidase
VTAEAAEAAPWWQGAVLYQVYVRSFRDSDGDGYGDLRGIVERLDHLSYLGVDAIWLSPTMPSPDQDWGYDVSDFTSVHPELGTMDDLEKLVAGARERGMKVLLDLVPNHTSVEHPWFVDARSSRDSPHRDFYVWADPAPGGGPPNNWRDSTGETAWTLDPPSGQYYLHNFLDSQADLNWWNPAVHEAFDQILTYWFDRGVAGFRIDVAHGLYKDAQLRDNPPPRPGLERFAHGGQDAVYSANRPESHAVFRRWRALAERYRPARLLLGETWVGEPDRLASFYGAGDELQLAFNFIFLFAPFEPRAMSAAVEATIVALPKGACPVWTGSNHDVSRFPSRWAAGDEAAARLVLTVLLTLPGTSVLYYGDELAMTDVDVAPADQRDPMTAGGRGGRPSRDRARTPMPWEDSPTGGFGPPGVRPWLPLGDRSRNVAEQRGRPGSTLELCRALVALRHDHQRGQVARYETLGVDEQLWSYRAGDLVVHANFSIEPRTVDGRGATLLCSSAPAAGAPAAGVARAARPAAGNALPGDSGAAARTVGKAPSGDGVLVIGPHEAVVLGDR